MGLPRRGKRADREVRSLNIGEIARRAGVSRSTVSYTLSGKRTISEATRRRIQDVIDKLGYRPNAQARALKEGRTRTIGLIIPPAGARLTDMQLSFIAGTVDAAARADLDVLLSSSGGDHDRSFERVITGGRVDGVVVMEIRLEDPRVVRLQRTGLPFVAIGRTARLDDLCWVDIDYSSLISQCVHHLADLGHRHIALINRSAEMLAAGYAPARRAQAGFVEAVAQRGIAGIQLCCADDQAAGQACIEKILAVRPKVTAVATITEAALGGVHRALERSGLVVPRDFSITGVVARHWAEEFEPPLTAADVPAAEMCSHAVALLVDRISDPRQPFRNVMLTPSVGLRGSTGPAPTARSARAERFASRRA
jgi:DNA-binding LacI/PurR family transcriptional regulator